MKQIGRSCITPQGPLAFTGAKLSTQFSLVIDALVKSCKNISCLYNLATERARKRIKEEILNWP